MNINSVHPRCGGGGRGLAPLPITQHATRRARALPSRLFCYGAFSTIYPPLLSFHLRKFRPRPPAPARLLLRLLSSPLTPFSGVLSAIRIQQPHTTPDSHKTARQTGQQDVICAEGDEFHRLPFLMKPRNGCLVTSAMPDHLLMTRDETCCKPATHRE